MLSISNRPSTVHDKDLLKDLNEAGIDAHHFSFTPTLYLSINLDPQKIERLNDFHSRIKKQYDSNVELCIQLFENSHLQLSTRQIQIEDSVQRKISFYNWPSTEIKPSDDQELAFKKLLKMIQSATCVANRLSLELLLARNEHWLNILTQTIAKSTITELNISFNELTKKEAPFLAKMIKKESPLKKLNLAYNHLDDEAITTIATPIKTNGLLKNLNLAGNHCSENGCQALIASLKGPFRGFCLDISSNPTGDLCMLKLAQHASENNFEYLWFNRENFDSDTGAESTLALVRKRANTPSDYEIFKKRKFSYCYMNDNLSQMDLK